MQKPSSILSCLDLSFSDIEMFSKFVNFCVCGFWEPLKLFRFVNTSSVSSAESSYMLEMTHRRQNIRVSRKNLRYWLTSWRNHCVFFHILKINSAKNLLQTGQQTNQTITNITHKKPRHRFTNPKRLVGEESSMCLESGDELV